MIGISNVRKSAGKEYIRTTNHFMKSNVNMQTECRTNFTKGNELPSLCSLKLKHPLVKGVKLDPQMKKGNSSK